MAHLFAFVVFQVIVGLNERFVVGDHDFSRGSLVPSVTIKIDIPEQVDDSWYKGSVNICIKEAVFQPSSPYRHVIELEKHLPCPLQTPVLMLYTDGGPDHRCTYLSVKCTLVYLWHKLDVDMLVLGRTPPGWSWKNPAERIMSQLNLALQSVGMMRTAADLPYEGYITR